MHRHLNFRTYRAGSTAPNKLDESDSARNARLERERAMRYIKQADDALRLAAEALQRAAAAEARS